MSIQYGQRSEQTNINERTLKPLICDTPIHKF
jgi:hypothetical protein